VIARPFLKWAGGKTSLLPQILPLVPGGIGTYYEPFLGGGSLFWELARERRFKRAVLGDINDRLVRTYTAVRDDVEKVISLLKVSAFHHNSDFFKEQREVNVDGLADAGVAAWMIYLNRTCFNGLYRVNKAGKFNVPLGRYANPTICDADNLRACSDSLQGVEIHCCDFLPARVDAEGADAFVYFDPPYYPVSDTSDFTAYAKEEFGPARQRQLAELLEALGAGGTRALLSNADCPWTRELYAGLPQTTIQARRSINSVATKRGPVSELLVRSFAYQPATYVGRERGVSKGQGSLFGGA
jgi:DNA adenine methylase